MKIQRFTILLLIVLCCLSCDKAPTALFEMDLFFEFNIPAGLNTLESHFFIIDDVPTFIQSQLASKGLSADDIGYINGITSSMETRFSGIDLNFVENIGVNFLEGTDNIERREAFYTFNDYVQFGNKTEIEMLPSLLDLKDQLLGETMSVEFKINLRDFLPQELDTRVNMKFYVYPPE